MRVRKTEIGARIVAPAALALLVGIGVVVAVTSVGAPAVAGGAERTVAVKRGVVQSTVSGSGTLSPANQLELSFGASGEVRAIYVKPGQHVSAGTLLAKIDPSSAEVDLAEALATLQSARDALTSAGSSASTTSASTTAGAAGTTALAARSAGAAMTVRTVALTAGEPRAGAAQATTPAPAATAPTTPQAAAEPPAAATATAVAKAKAKALAKAKASAKAKALATAKSATARAAAGSSSAAASPGAARSSAGGSGGATAAGGSGAGGSGSGGATSVASATAAVKSAELSVVKAQRALAATKLRAPVAGTIAAVNGAVGDTVGSGSSAAASSASANAGSNAAGAEDGAAAGGSGASDSGFITLAQVSRFRMDVSLSESDIGKVKVGQAATVTVNAVSGTQLAAHVARVGVLASSSSSSGAVSYPVTLKLDQSATKLKAGMSATADIVVAQASGLTLPSQAVTGSSVVVVRAGRRTTQTVQTGVVGESSTQILSGLREGDVVVVRSASAAAGANAGAGTGTQSGVGNGTGRRFGGGALPGGGAFPGGGVVQRGVGP